MSSIRGLFLAALLLSTASTAFGQEGIGFKIPSTEIFFTSAFPNNLLLEGGIPLLSIFQGTPALKVSVKQPLPPWLTLGETPLFPFVGAGLGFIVKGNSLYIVPYGTTSLEYQPPNSSLTFLAEVNIGLSLSFNPFAAGFNFEGSLGFRFGYSFSLPNDRRPMEALPPLQPGEPPLPPIRDKWALLIGISNYEYINDLEYAADDALLMKVLLVRRAAFPEDHVTFLWGDQATKAGIEQAFARLSDIVKEDDLVIIYYAGHGTVIEDKDGDEGDGLDEALVPYDYHPGDEAGLIVDDLFGWWVNRLRSRRVVVIVDSCYSGGTGRTITVNPAFTRAVSDNSIRDIFTDDKGGRILLAASKAGQIAHEAPDLRHGLFTYYLAEALRGRGDENNDGQITIEEAFRYAEERMYQYTHSTGIIQTPVMIDAIPGDVPIVQH